MAPVSLGKPLLGGYAPEKNGVSVRKKVVATVTTIAVAALLLLYNYTDRLRGPPHRDGDDKGRGYVVESEVGVVAADDKRCSEAGASALRKGGHAVDAAVAITLCVGVVNPMASGIGGGGFMVLRSTQTGKSQAYNFRETAPLAASQNMYDKNPSAKNIGALSIGVPGELAGLHAAWLHHGRLPWHSLFQVSIKLARDGFVVTPYLVKTMTYQEKAILKDPGLREVFAPHGRLLQPGDTCYNLKLASTLQLISEQGPQVLYNGTIGENLVRDVQEAGGILTMEDLRQYQVEVTDAMAVDAMGYTILGMPPPSSGTVGLALVLNILDSYGTVDAAKGSLGLHRLIESLKHMLALRMNLGDPNFVNNTDFVAEMLSPSFAKQIQQKILDNTTFPPSYYETKWSQLKDHGTSHFCIVDADRNALSMTTTVNYYFGARLLSPSTGVVLNDEMDDFSTPTENTTDGLPPAPSNFIEPNKRPLSSMTPIIILKGDQVAGVIGGSGGIYIIPTVIQVFLNHFVFGKEPLAAVQHPRVYHQLTPNVVFYENWTMYDGDHIELSQETKLFLKERGHKLEAQSYGGICQLVVHNLAKSTSTKNGDGRGWINGVFHGILTAVSDPRKDGKPVAL